MIFYKNLLIFFCSTEMLCFVNRYPLNLMTSMCLPNSPNSLSTGLLHIFYSVTLQILGSVDHKPEAQQSSV